MSKITVQAKGRYATLGKTAAQPDRLLAANGHGVIQESPARENANANAVPLARSETGLLGTTRIATPTGQTMVQDLAPGDVIADAQGNPVTVKHVLKTTVTKSAICLRAPYFGLDQDLVIGPDHRIAVTSDTAEYLFGEETVLVPSWAVKDGRKAQHWELPPKTNLYQIQLETAAAVKVGNCAVESMPKSGQAIGKILTIEEARCFFGEHRSGYQN